MNSITVILSCVVPEVEAHVKELIEFAIISQMQNCSDLTHREREKGERVENQPPQKTMKYGLLTTRRRHCDKEANDLNNAIYNFLHCARATCLLQVKGSPPKW